MQRETARLEQSVQTFLEYARPPKLEKHADDLRQTIQETLDLIAARADRQRVVVQWVLPAEPLWIEADHDQLRQVFLNLLFNALDVLPNGGRLTVAASVAVGADTSRPVGPDSHGSADAKSPVSPGGHAGAGAKTPVSPGGHAGAEETKEGADGWVVVTITDSGPGLSAEIADRVFQPYVSTKETGLGLGLAICRRIVEAHDGEIAVENGPAGGAVFTVRLPCQTATIHGQR